MENERRLAEDFVVSTILRARGSKRKEQSSLGENLKILLEEGWGAAETDSAEVGLIKQNIDDQEKKTVG
jgi:hypothetical protein